MANERGEQQQTGGNSDTNDNELTENTLTGGNNSGNSYADNAVHSLNSGNSAPAGTAEPSVVSTQSSSTRMANPPPPPSSEQTNPIDPMLEGIMQLAATNALARVQRTPHREPTELEQVLSMTSRVNHDTQARSHIKNFYNAHPEHRA